MSGNRNCTPERVQGSRKTLIVRKKQGVLFKDQTIKEQLKKRVLARYEQVQKNKASPIDQ